jgi:hypothetical protein
VGFAEAPARASLRRKLENLQATAIASDISRGEAFSAPFFEVLLPQKKGEGKFLVYFRFLSDQ